MGTSFNDWAASREEDTVWYDVFSELTRQRIDAVYHCKRCDVEGRDPEVNGVVLCWCCGHPPSVTARLCVS